MLKEHQNFIEELLPIIRKYDAHFEGRENGEVIVMFGNGLNRGIPNMEYMSCMSEYLFGSEK